MAKHTILHVMRSPVGGLFRHVVDLARAQTARGHAVGIFADASTGGERADTILVELSRDLAHGVIRAPMSRDLGTSDWSAGRAVAARIAEIGATIVHGHGSKGGAYARLVGGKALKVYTPHGGSLHYSRATAVGFVYLTLEALLARRTDLFLFESAYGRDTFREKVQEPSGVVRVVHNGVGAAEFEPIAPVEGASDLLFVGELRELKGVDVLIEAITLLHERGQAPTATIVGDGPDADSFRALVERRGLTEAIAFAGARPAREAFRLGRVLVVPSRAESLPYVILEAAAAGLPVIASAVGGIGEIFGSETNRLVTAGDPIALADAIAARQMIEPARLTARVREGFSVDAMTESVLSAYDDALARR